MANADRPTITIGQWMVTIAVVGLIIALLANQSTARGFSITAGFLGTAFIFVVGCMAAVDFFLGIRCPRCGKWTMGRTSIASFRDRFFRCSTCGVRARRGLLRGWEDASAREFDHYYARKRPENPWTAPPGVEDEDLVYSKTHVNLLLNKKRRNPDAPDQWTARPGDTGER
jgi:predicted RNA-binding Zn-ribbon protein involved in translation (DUF1610 family)